MNNKPILALDGDGVVFDFEATFKDITGNLLDRKTEILHPEIYSLPARYELDINTVKNALRIIDKYNLFYSLPLYDNMSDCLYRLSEKYHIVMVTQLSAKNAALRKQRIIDLNLPIQKLYAVTSHKESVLKHLKPAIFVDDYLQHIKEGISAGVKENILCRKICRDDEIADLNIRTINELPDIL